MTTILAGGRPLTLLPEKAALIAASGTLLIADAHIGKAVSFRALGVPVPRGTTSETLARLGALVARTGASRIVFLGDFLHSARAHATATLAALAAWRDAHRSLELVLVRGNHDDRAGDPPASLGMQVVDEPFTQDGLALCHHPKQRAGAYVLAGHLHPCVHVGGRGWEHLRLPCFWFGDDVGVLPAFGAFTGMHPIRAIASDRVFAIADSVVAAMPSAGERCAA
ncbi:MAG: ligase-associated DNA damage response endonuclease PdeM [Caldimonas sp.]